VTGIIFIVWISFFFAKLRVPTQVIIPSPRAETAQERVDKILEDAQYGVELQTTDSGPTTDAESLTSESLVPGSLTPGISPDVSPKTDDWSADLYRTIPRVE
jgi:hypothetical protein